MWKKCSSCKKPLDWGSQYYVCSVSTCNGLRTGYVFCSMPCFEVHLPGARHRDAGGIKKTAPLQTSQSQVGVPETPGVRIIPKTQSVAKPKEILIVASKLKDYIFDKSQMNTSAAVMDILSDIVRRACDEAIDQARVEGRKTVLDRDFKSKNS